METTTLVAPDISCEHCQHAIEGALGELAGVDTVKVDTHCLTKIFLSSLQADMFPRLYSGLSSKAATSLICSGAGEAHGIR